MLAPREGGLYVDATFGAGGYSRAILAAADTRVIGIDRDRTAIAGGFGLVEESGGRLTLVEDRFSNLAEVCAAQGADAVDGIVMDVGVSSMQLDEADRGFSFGSMVRSTCGWAGMGRLPPTWWRARPRPISPTSSIFSARSVARAPSPAPSSRHGGSRRSRRRERWPISCREVVRAKPHEIHPATRTFQALRIFVNEELDELIAALSAAEHVLKPGGRLAVVSFHSLEDRIVKNFLAVRGKTGGGSRHRPEIERSAPSFAIRPTSGDGG